MERYVVLNKKVGETPLECAEAWRTTRPDLANIPLAYAGRLDPLASGKLLVLIGEECKRQTEYHNLDKTYEIEVVFGLASDTGDVMGLLQSGEAPVVSTSDISRALTTLTGTIELPYPAYSSKTVAGKPLHTWALEGRLNEITIPTKTSTIYRLKLNTFSTISGADLYEHALATINSIPTVTDDRKALGNDFRRDDIRSAWATWLPTHKQQSFPLARITCTASSGTYMRTLANCIAQECGTIGLATKIHRTEIGTYYPLPLIGGIWTKRY